MRPRVSVEVKKNKKLANYVFDCTLAKKKIKKIKRLNWCLYGSETPEFQRRRQANFKATAGTGDTR